MTLIQELTQQATTGALMQAQHLKRFSAAEIREAIQGLVATEQVDLAYALGDAGLSIYPASEDMLAMNGLLAVMRSDWPQAVELLEDLVYIQAERTQPFTYVMLVRALRCNLDPLRAIQVVQQGLAAYPEQMELIAEALDLEAYADTMSAPSGYTH